MKKVFFRFYEELNDFLPKEKRKIKFEHSFIDRTSVKDLIESIGVPHTEVDLILVNGKSVNFSYVVNDNDEISVYPVFESFDISNVQHLREKPLRIPRFIADVHLGSLVKLLRLFGLNVFYQNNLNEKDIVRISLEEKRTILTKNKNILKRNDVTHGYWIRNTNPEKQAAEVIQRFHLFNEIKTFSRCLICNTELAKVDKEKVGDKIPRKVQEWQDEYYLCPKCNKVYWKGSHFKKMEEKIKEILYDFS